jgi:hypothetical protein
LLRGEVAYGSESVMREAEARDQPYRAASWLATAIPIMAYI